MTIGDSSPAVAATRTSSTSRRPSLDPSLLNQRATLVVPREPQEVVIAEPLSELGGLGRGGMGGLVVAPSHLLEPDGDQQIAALDAVLLDAFEQAPPSREPSTRSPALAPEEQVVADPERAPSSGRHLLDFKMRMVGALQSADVVVVSAEHVRSPRKELEIPRVEWRGPIRAGQRLERFAPRALGVGRATLSGLDDRIHRTDYRARAINSLPVDRRSLARIGLMGGTRGRSAACPRRERV